MEISSKVYKIGALARECEISPHLVRAWERRHHFLEPMRGTGGQRLFSHEELLILRYITAAIKNGARIGELAALGRKRLLLEAGADNLPGRMAMSGEKTNNTAASTLTGHAERLVAAAIRVDGLLLRSALSVDRMELSCDTIIYEVIPRAMAMTDVACLAGAMGIGGEHLISNIMEQFIKNALEEAHKAGPDEVKPVAICCCFPDEEHRIGLLTVAYALARQGRHIVYLGSAMPLAAVEQSIRQIQPESVWLSVTDSNRYKKHREELAALATRQNIRFMIGGQGAARADKLLHQAGCRLCPSFVKLPDDILRLAAGGFHAET